MEKPWGKKTKASTSISVYMYTAVVNMAQALSRNVKAWVCGQSDNFRKHADQKKINPGLTF